MTQPPKMSPLALQSAGMGMTLSTNSRSLGRSVWGRGLASGDMGTICETTAPDSPPMRRASPTLPLPAESGPSSPPAQRSDWATLRRLFPYLWQYKWRVMAALAFMVAAKLANVGVPLLLKELVDAMSIA